MVKERKTGEWEKNSEEVRRLFTLTPDDLYFLSPLRVDSQRLYRALVLVWARVERVLLSETSSIPAGVITHVCKQLGLSPVLLDICVRTPQCAQQPLRQCAPILRYEPFRKPMRIGCAPT